MIATVIVFIALSFSVYAQMDTCTIVPLSGDSLKYCVLDSLSGNNLFFHQDAVSRDIHIDSLSVIIRRTHGNFWSGAWPGALVGAGIGAVIGYLRYEKQTGFFDFGPELSAIGAALLGLPAGALLGGIIAAVSYTTETHDIAQEATLDAKRLKVKALLDVKPKARSRYDRRS